MDSIAVENPVRLGPGRSMVLLLIWLTLAGFGACSEAELEPVQVDLARFPSAPRSGERATVLLFVGTDCPISNAYAPEMRRLWEDYVPRGVAFHRVYAEPALGLSVVESHARDYDLPMPAIRDPEQLLARITGASVTPEAVVLDREGRMVYRGRIDDLFVDLGERREQPQHRDLRAALEGVLAAEPAPGFTSTQAIGCVLPPAESSAPSEEVGFGPELAGLVATHCAGCHRPGGSAPFSLLGYEDVAKRARQIRAVTESRFMPPWKPEPGHGRFVGERRLADADLERLQRWIDAGARPGVAAEALAVAAEAPVDRATPGAWELGQPDRVYAMPQPYAVPAEGLDDFRSFVLPTGMATERFVEAVEFRVDNLRVTHHAILQLDLDGAARAADAASPEPGYPGMELALYPGHGGMDGWIPGMTQRRLPEGLAWRLPAGADFVVEGHFRPSGRPEEARFELGLHFADQAPQGELALIRLAVGGLNIPAGETGYAVQDAFELPVDVRVVGIAPHAHRICRDIRAEARLPSGEAVPLVWIRDWDFDWQDVYRYVEPVELPRGARLEMAMRFDNSSSNPRNPHTPPRRVLGGTTTSDEMAFVWLQVVVRDVEQAAILAEAMARHTDSKAADYRLEALWRALVASLEMEPDGLLDAQEDAAVRAYLLGLSPDDELVLTTFDADGSGALDEAEGLELQRFLEPWRESP